MHERNGLKAFGKRPHRTCGISAAHWATQAVDSKKKNSQVRDPRPMNEKSTASCRQKEHTQPQGHREAIHARSGDEKGSEDTASKRAQNIRSQAHYSRQDRGDGEHSKTQMRRNAKLPSSRNSLCGFADERRLSEPR